MQQAFLLDTNVISEFMRPEPDANVISWFGTHIGSEFYISSITKAEILLGIELLTAGKRRERLFRAANTMFQQDFFSKCLAFDASCAQIYAVLVSKRMRAGDPVSTEDAQIAAVSLANNLVLVTRNTKDFTGIQDLHIINPWQKPH